MCPCCYSCSDAPLCVIPVRVSYNILGNSQEESTIISQYILSHGLPYEQWDSFVQVTLVRRLGFGKVSSRIKLVEIMICVYFWICVTICSRCTTPKPSLSMKHLWFITLANLRVVDLNSDKSHYYLNMVLHHIWQSLSTSVHD